MFANYIDVARFWDHKIFFALNGLSGSIPVYFGWLTELGSIFILPLLILAALVVWDRRNFIKKFPWLCVTLVGTRLAGQGLKFAVQRPRPLVLFADEIAQGRLVIHTFPGLHQSQSSFPSGHTVVAFAAATALCILYGRKLWFLYIPAALVALSRVLVGAHFPSDVLAGALIGTGGALVFGLFLDKKK